jgi:hypothetical protein
VGRQALAKAADNPLAATLHLLATDLISFAHAFGDRLRARLETGESPAATTTGAIGDAYLKFVR